MKAIKKNLNKVATNIDGKLVGIGQGFAHVRDKLIHGDKEEEYDAPPGNKDTIQADEVS